MTAFELAMDWIREAVDADPARFTVHELRAANRVLVASIECPWGPENENPVPFESCDLFGKLKRWFMDVIEIPSRLRPREYAEAQQIVAELLKARGQGGPRDVREITRPSVN